MRNWLFTLLMLAVFNNGYADEWFISSEDEFTCHFYSGLLGGVNCEKKLLPHLDQRASGIAAGFCGYQFENHLRLEGEVAYTQFSEKLKYELYESYKTKINASKFCLLGNILYEIPFCYNISSYFGVGMGWGYTRTRMKMRHKYYGSVLTNTIYSDCFVWQSIAGFAYTLNEYKFGIDYRKVTFGNSKGDNVIAFSVARAF